MMNSFNKKKKVIRNLLLINLKILVDDGLIDDEFDYFVDIY